jgi:hypothetical protein
MITIQATLKTLIPGQHFFFDEIGNNGEPHPRWFRVSWLEGDGRSDEPKILFARNLRGSRDNFCNNQPFMIAKHGNRLVQVDQSPSNKELV